MEEYLRKLKSKPKKQRVIMFWAALAISGSLVLMFFFAIRSPETREQSEYHAEIEMPQIKNMMKEYFATGKEMMFDAKNNISGAYRAVKDVLQKAKEIQRTEESTRHDTEDNNSEQAQEPPQDADGVQASESIEGF